MTEPNRMRSLLLLAAALLLGTACAAPTVEPAPAAAPTADPPAVATAVPTATSAPTAPPTAVRADLPDLGPAPAWSNAQWINSEPLPLAGLRGKVVLLEFWTFG